MENQKRKAWIDIAKGISIILVVMMYAVYNTGEHTGQVGFLHYVIGFATPFRMPEFFLISGLFLSRVIDRPWKGYADRRAIHYFYFYGLWASIMIALKTGVYGADPVDMVRELALAVIQPYGVLWFIYMLAVFGLMAKLLRQSGIPHWILVPAAALLQMTQIESPSYVVKQLADYFVFFYAGYVFAPQVFRLADWAHANRRQAAIWVAAWAVVNGLLVYSPGYSALPTHTEMGYASFPPLHFALAITGAFSLCVFSKLISEFRSAEWVRWLGEHSLVVYLAFTIPMSLSREFALWSGVLTKVGPLSAAVLVVSLASPVVLYWMVGKAGMGTFLFERPAWAFIADARPGSLENKVRGRSHSNSAAISKHRAMNR